MRKKIIGILVCTLMIVSLPSAFGMKKISRINEDIKVDSKTIFSQQFLDTLNPTFNRTWGTSNEDYGRHAEIYENFVYCCGYCNHTSFSGSGDIFLLKYDSSGNIIWETTFDGGDYETAYYVTGYDGYIYLCGSTMSYSEGGLDIILLKYDTDGNLIWYKTWGGQNDEGSYEIVAYNNYLYICGYTTSYGAGSYDGILLKYDTDGNLIWYKSYGGEGYDDFAGITAYDNYIYVTGQRDSYASMTLLKYDTDGNIIFEKSWSEEPTQFGNAVIIYEDNIYIVGGMGEGVSTNEQLSISLVKCDMNGNLKWIQKWHQGMYRNWAYDLEPYGDFIYVTGRTCPTNNYISDLALLKYNLNGDLEWAKIWRAPDKDSHEYGRSIQINNDYIYISGGTGINSGPVSFDALLLKCDLNGEKGNNNPNKPDSPSGPNRGKVGEEIEYSVSTIDIDGDEIKFLFDWGDGNTTWTDWVHSGEIVSASHIWVEKGTYEIRVKARDKKGGDSEWSNPLSVSIPRNRVFSVDLLEKFMKKILLLNQLL